MGRKSKRGMNKGNKILSRVKVNFYQRGGRLEKEGKKFADAIERLKKKKRGGRKRGQGITRPLLIFLTSIIKTGERDNY